MEKIKRYDLQALDRDIDCRRYAIFALHMQPGGKPYEVQAAEIDALLHTDKPIAFPCPSMTHMRAGEGDYTHFYVYPHFAICYSGKCNLHEYDGEEKWLRPGKNNTIGWKTLGYLYKRNILRENPDKITLGSIAYQAAQSSGNPELYVKEEGEGQDHYFPYAYEEMKLIGLIPERHCLSFPDQEYTDGRDEVVPSWYRAAAEYRPSAMEELRDWYASDKETCERYIRTKAAETLVRIEEAEPEGGEITTLEAYSLHERIMHDKNTLYRISDKMGMTHENPKIKYW